MNRGKRRLLVALIFALIGGFLPGGNAQAQKVVIAQGVDADTLDPNAVFTIPSQVIYSNIFDSLFGRDRDLKFINQLATSYHLVNPTQWRFQLRKGVSFHNGEPFNAEAVKFSYDQIYAPTSKSIKKGQFIVIDKVDVVDDYTVDITTKKPDPILPARLSLFYAIPPKYVKEVGDAKFSQNPVGTGPFKFVKWIKDDQIILERNEKYWGGAHPVKELIFRSIPETQARLAALQTGEVDIATNIPPDLVKRMDTKGRFEFKSTLTSRVIFLPLSTNQKSPLTEKKVRQAVNYAIDRESIVRNILEGYGEIIPSLVPKVIFGFDPNLKAYAFDLQKAKQLLAEAGYPNGFEIEMHGPSGRYMRDKEVCQAIVGQLAQVGIKVNLKIVEWGSYLKSITSHTQAPLYLLGWSIPTMDPDHWLWVNLHTGEPFSQFSDPQLDKLLEQARYEMDVKKREKLYQDIQKLVLDQAYLCVLYETKDLFGVNKRIDWNPRADEMIFLRDLKMAK